MTRNKIVFAPETAHGSFGSAPTVLLLSDPAAPGMLNASVFEQAGLTTFVARDLDSAARLLNQSKPNMVFAQLSLSGQPTRSLIEQAGSRKPKPKIVIVATNDEINAAAEAMRAGADDCLFWPFSERRLTNTIASALGTRAVPGPASATAQALPDPSGPPMQPTFNELQSVSLRMRAVLDHIDALAHSDVPVALAGPPGSGKALLARRLHRKSPRARAPFVQIDCAALPPDGIEAALFGPQGAFARALRGTLYLENPSHCPPSTQQALLRQLDAHSGEIDVRPFTGMTSLPTDAASASPLVRRFCVAPVLVPGLRDRREDIRPLAEALARDTSPTTAFNPDALVWLSAQDWPGNLNQLRDVTLAACRRTPGPRITKTAVQAAYGDHATSQPDTETAPEVAGLLGKPSKRSRKS